MNNSIYYNERPMTRGKCLTQNCRFSFNFTVVWVLKLLLTTSSPQHILSTEFITLLKDSIERTHNDNISIFYGNVYTISFDIIFRLFFMTPTEKNIISRFRQLNTQPFSIYRIGK